ncbi:hypothetical protein HY625_02995 [Candidatus Uhrbacteria bacterium]|nr:hypothetical protein [Candidatus Uhrbacteria bacterium]
MPSQNVSPLEWEFSEFVQHERGTVWYFCMTLIAGGLVLWSLFTGNFLFALIIILVAALFIIYEQRGPRTMVCHIDDDGITVNGILHPYKEMKDFRIVYEPPVKVLYVIFQSMLQPRLTIALADQNPLAIRERLQKNVLEDIEQDGETLSDLLSRLFKL